jgi:hypothetical protein
VLLSREKSKKASSGAGDLAASADDGDAAEAARSVAASVADAKPSGRPATAPSGRGKARPPKDTVSSGEHMAGVAVGDVAQARHHQKWVPVRIEARNADGSFDVTPLSGKSSKLHRGVPANHLRPMSADESGSDTSPDMRPSTARAAASPSGNVVQEVDSTTDEVAGHYKVGQEVQVNAHGSGQWLHGVILKDHGHHQYEVRVTKPDGRTEEARVKRRLLRPAASGEKAPSLGQQLNKDSSANWSFSGALSRGGSTVGGTRMSRGLSLGASFDGELESAGLLVGTKVRANLHGKGRWYPGVITAECENGTFCVCYDDGQVEEDVEAGFIKPLAHDLATVQEEPAGGESAKAPAACAVTSGGADPTAPLQEGDKVDGNFRGRGAWLPASIDRVRNDGTLDLDYDSGEHETRVNASNVRRPLPAQPPVLSDGETSAPLQEGDIVDAKHRDKNVWVPARVDRVRADGSFDLDYYTGEHEVRVPADRVRRPLPSFPAVGEAKNGAADTSTEEQTPVAPLQEGDKVEGNFRGQGTWLAATVDRIRPDSSFDLDYANGEHERRMPAESVRRPVAAAAPTTTTVEPQPPAALQEGDRVEGNYHSKGRWYPARIDRIRADGTMDLDYDDGEHERRMAPENVRRPLLATTSGAPHEVTGKAAHLAHSAAHATAQPGLQTHSTAPLMNAVSMATAGLHVGQKVMCDYRGKNRWYPATITAINQDATYNVDYDDGEKETSVRAARVTPMEITSASRDLVTFQLGDKVDVLYAHSNRKFPARITKAHGDGSFDVRYDDGEKEQHVPAVKISYRAAAAQKQAKRTGTEQLESDKQGPKGLAPLSNEPEPAETSTTTQPVPHTTHLNEGDKVEANYRGKGRWYPGGISRVHVDGTFDVDYDDGEKETHLPAEAIRLVAHVTTQSAEHAALEEGSRVEGNYRGRSRWYPATIDRIRTDGTFDLNYDDGEREARVTLDLVRAASTTVTKVSSADAAIVSEAPLQEGDKVEGNYLGQGSWLAATVDRIRHDGSLDLYYDNGQREARMHPNCVRRPQPATSAPTDEDVSTHDSDAAQENAGTESALGPLQEGDRAEGNYRSAGTWLPAVVDRVRADGSYDLDYDDGSREVHVAPELVRRPHPAAASSSEITSAAPEQEEPAPEWPLQEGDKVEGDYRGRGTWLPATVDRVRADGSVDLDYDNGEREARMAPEHVRRPRSQQPAKHSKAHPAPDVAATKSIPASAVPTADAAAHAPAAAANPGNADPASVAASFQVGARVEANYRNRGKWYPGHVKRIRDDGSVDIKYDDGGFEARVDASQVRVASHDDPAEESQSVPSTPAGATGVRPALSIQSDRSSNDSSAAPTPTRPDKPGTSFASPLKGSRTIKARFDSDAQPTADVPLATAAAIASTAHAAPTISSVSGSAVHVERVVRDAKANYRNKGIWLPIRVITEREHGLFDVVYDDGDVETGLIPDRIFPPPKVTSIAEPPHFAAGLKVEVNYHGKGVWLPAIIANAHSDGTFDVDYADGESEERLPEKWVRASASDAVAASPPAVSRQPPPQQAQHTNPANGSAAATPKKQVRYDTAVKGVSPPNHHAISNDNYGDTDAELAAMLDLQFFDETSVEDKPHAVRRASSGSADWDDAADFQLSDDEAADGKYAHK